ncbi:hypothetical protein J6590_072271 [Homalodisca vitripennis]|nr:hypothetical protein J6590_072271 [Homalodisca vitripennis]
MKPKLQVSGDLPGPGTDLERSSRQRLLKVKNERTHQTSIMPVRLTASTKPVYNISHVTAYEGPSLMEELLYFLKEKQAENQSQRQIKHQNHIHGLVKFVEKSVRSGTKIRGVLCNSEGGLLDIRPTCLLPLDFFDDGREDDVFSHLESVLTSSKEKSKTVNSSHHTFCLTPAAQEGSKHYSPHGLHLQASAKRLLPDYCVETGQHNTAAPSTFPCADVRTFS